ncbi:hypothetical protein CKF43_00925 [Pantoea graminicola]|uniref:hypothetical protein n=1 Tax=Pantoea sp. ARC607 TaxID=2027922 RepID=UPI000DA7C47E|nr:hypothetical protein [Pantoea sp. ARC607]PZL98874.1 hypothetical protein CKF43_00925 [Pantoea sp. ARC607]
MEKVALVLKFFTDFYQEVSVRLIFRRVINAESSKAIDLPRLIMRRCYSCLCGIYVIQSALMPLKNTNLVSGEHGHVSERHQPVSFAYRMKKRFS